jgi:hypothetical protein
MNFVREMFAFFDMISTTDSKQKESSTPERRLPLQESIRSSKKKVAVKDTMMADESKTPRKITAKAKSAKSRSSQKEASL